MLVVSCANSENNPDSSQLSSTITDGIDYSESEEEIEQNLLKEFPDYFKIKVVKGKLDSDSLMDYFYILDSDKEKRNTSKCVLIFGKQKRSQQRKIVFDDLLPSISMSGKIEEPFETIRLSSDTLLVCFASSEYGHNELYKGTYSLKFNTQKQTFSLVHFKYEVCILPECDYTASIEVFESELVNSGKAFSFENWVISGGCFSSLNVAVSKKNIMLWKRFSEELKQIGLEDKSKSIEVQLF